MSQDIKTSVWIPLSAAQRGRWFAYRFDPESRGTHNNAFAARIIGHLDKAKLVHALARLLQRHAMLRASFRDNDGEPEQQIVPFVIPPVTVINTTGWDLATLLERVRLDCRKGFSLAEAPLLRVNLYRATGERDDVLLLVFDHIICDGWSYWHILDELGALLADADVDTAVQESHASYIDYMNWQRSWLNGSDSEAQLRYWQENIGTDLPLLHLPQDRAGVRHKAHRNETVTMTLDVRETKALQGFSRHHQLGSLFVVLLAAYQILLHRYSGQEQIIVGSPMPGRGEGDWDEVIGDFVNLIPLKADFTNAGDVSAFLRAVRNTVFGGMENQDYPFLKLVEQLQPIREEGVHPLFQTVFVFHKARRGASLLDLWGSAAESAAAVAWGGVTLGAYPVHQSGGNSNFGLMLETIELNGGLRCDFKFDAEIFDAASIERMASHFRAILDSMLVDAHQPIATLAMLGADERHQLLDRFNDTAVPFPRESLIQQLFEAQVALRPEAIAITFGQQTLCYRELNQRANQIAHYLLGLGVKPDSRVAICMERGIGLVLGLLGILKSGAAYVPLDPTHPPERLAYMLGDSAPVVLLTSASLRARLTVSPAVTQIPVFAWDEEADAAQLASQPQHDPDPLAMGLLATHLAQVIYTSGSTGLPKGVMVTHRNVLRLVINNPYCRLDADDCMVQCANPAFDATTWEVWSTLLVGASLLVIPQMVLLNGAQFCQQIIQGKATSLLLTVGLFNEYVDVLAPAIAGLKYLLVGGDALDPRTVARLLKSGHRPRHLVNAYGPTECTVIAAAHEILSVAEGANTIPIGRPIGNTRIVILDRHMQLVPIGVAGEIHVGGAGVARGYLNQAELTKERFVNDPFCNEAGAQLYRTGDLGRWLPDGSIEFLGRNDFQVKIRGFRIELGEVEARLAACDGVREALVIAREDSPGDKRLVAYLIPQEGVELDAVVLRQRLLLNLAQYMVPSAFVSVAAYPLTSTGKLDRKALPMPDSAALALQEYEAPQGETERALARIWHDLLGVAQPGRHDHFFELGGHSLLAIQLVSRLRHSLGVELVLRDLFVHPTLAGMATLVENARQVGYEMIMPADRTLPLPLSWAQQRLWFLDQLDHAAGAAYHISAGLRLNGHLDKRALHATLDRIVARHEILRTRFVMVDGAAVQKIAAPDVGFTLREYDLRELTGHEQAFATARHSMDEMAHPFNLAHGPLIRGQLLCISEVEHVLLVTQHHIISDGWSISILIKEIQALYRAFSQGQADPLPPLTLQYADYAVWQRGWLQGEVQRAQLDYWKKHLDGAPALLELPLDHPRPTQQSYVGGMVELNLSPILSAGLRSLSQQHGTTLFMTLLAGWAILMARLSGQDDVVIGTPVANRQRSEVEALIGFFVNTLAMRVRMENDPDVSQLLNHVKQLTLGAYAHQDLPFEQVVEAINPHRSMSHSPVFQVMLAMNNANSVSELSLPGLKLSEIEQAHITTHFDLMLSFTDSGEAIHGSLEYASSLFEEATIARIGQCFQTILGDMVRDPQSRVSRLRLLDEVAQQQMLSSLNASGKLALAYPAQHLVHQLFEDQVRARPSATALVYGGQSMSSDELNRYANRIAHCLLKMGVKPDDRVAICVERSLEMVAGLLAILKAGAAYVPLDPVYPAERLAYMLSDSEPVAMLTQATLHGQLNKLPLPPLLLLDDTGALAHYADTNPEPAAMGLHGGHLAYIIYTSGSTGLPKGVMVEHRSLVNLIGDWAARFALSGSDAAIASFWTSFGFDVSLFEIFMPLAVGAALHVVPDAVRNDPNLLFDWLVEQRISMAYLPAFLIRKLKDYSSQQLATLHLKRILVGVEPLPEAELYRLKKCMPHLKVVNGYGPTEATVFSTTYADIANLQRHAPIGKPIANTQIYILDSQQQLVPLGVMGEIHIGGAGLARGYLNLPDMSSERFITDPFSAIPGSRMYRTGDLGRWLADGNIEYIGRNDFQVKLRGFRIELGEIENKLLTCPGVREALVIAREDIPGDKRLVAYLIAQDGATLVVDDLRNQLAAGLADYMVPSAFVSLSAYPLTPNGKLDRKALPVPDLSAVAKRRYEAPQGEMEQKIAHIWQELLGLEGIGRNDNFFHLGGNSLTATRLIARINQCFDVNLSLRMIFVTQSLEALAHKVRQAGVAGTGEALPAILPIERGEDMQTSYAQQRLWLLDQIDGGSAHYNMPSVVRLSGQLDREALDRAFICLWQRHESLRTCFRVDQNGQVLQVIQPAPSEGLPLIDLTQLPDAERERQMEALIDAEAADPFDLSRDLMLRGKLIKLSEEAYLLLVTMHHIASDGWSVAILVSEFSALYQAFVAGQADPLLPLAIQYADYAHWQRHYLQGEVLAHQLDYWTEQLADIPLVHSLPLDFPRPASQTFNGDVVKCQLDAATSRDLHALCSAHGATLFMGLHAAFSVLLARYGNETDIVVGSPIANREQEEVVGLIGFFINNLVLRSDLSGNPSFVDLLEQSRKTLLDAYAHQQVPWEQIIERLRPERHLSYSPLFQVMLNLHNNQVGELALPGLTASIEEHGKAPSKFDLSLDVTENDQGMGLAWEFNTDLFLPATIAAMAQHFMVLLQQLLAHPEQSVFKAEMVSTQERQQLLFGWNDTRVDFPLKECIQQLFEAQVETQPDAIAVEYEGQQLSFADLNRQANQLAHYLIEHRQVRPDSLVGICLDRSLAMIVGMLGILKAGGAYVPLDPDYPAQRLTYMLQDANLATVLTHAKLLGKTPIAPSQALCLDLPDVQAQLRAQPDRNIAPSTLGLAAHHLVYVIYTSGSTGNPKGVMISHANLMNLSLSVQRRYQLTAADGFLQFATINFDMSVEDIFSSLVSGCRLVLRSDAWLQSAAEFWQRCAAAKVTVLDLPTAFWHELANDRQSAPPPCVRHVSIGGEQVNPAMIREWFAKPHSRNLRLLNTYGPTECTVDSTFADIAADGDGFCGIGKALSNYQLLVLNRELALVPAGLMGELHVGGAGLARGYLNRDDLTAEKFIANPFYDDSDGSAPHSRRLYKTGDLVRWMPDGNLEFMGRIDHQVKIRGFRIELGEIEAALGQHELVKGTIVLARDDLGNGKRLVAYLLLDGGQWQHSSSVREGMIDEVRQHLAQRLPDYMLPSAIMLLDSWPLTPNGKLDRGALPAPDQVAGVAHGDDPPQGAIEQAIADIWQDLLRLECVGRNDHFFSLGGHSLLAIQLVSRLRIRFGVEVALRDLFVHTSVAELAVLVGNAQAAGFLAIKPVARGVPLPLSFAQQRLWFLDQLDHAASAAYHMSAGLRFCGQLDKDALRAALDRIIARHESLRTSFATLDGEPMQIIGAAAGGFALREQDLRELTGAAQQNRVDAISAAEAAEPFDLAQGPLLRGQLLHLSEDESVLLITQHHIISDGWSIGLFVTELQALYVAFSQGQADPLPPLSLQYADYAVWQRDWLQGAVLARQVDFWKNHLSGAPALLELPLDYPRPAQQTHAGGAIALRLPAALSQGLRELSQRHGMTLFMTLLAGWTVLLARLSGQDDVVVGTPVANRQRSELEPLIGFFANTLALRVRLENDPSVAQLLAQVKAATLGAFEHQDLPFEQVVEIVKPPRSMAHSPIFQVMLTMNSAPGVEDLVLPGLTLAPLAQVQTTAQFDLSLSLADTGTVIEGNLVYASALFDEATMTRFSRRLQTVLADMVADAQQPVSRLALLDADERHQLLQVFNATRSAWPQEQLLHRMFEAQVARQADAPALLFQAHSLSYAGLNRRANQIAWYLLEQGVRPDQRIALCVERGIDMVVALLGILKAGAAYVPLDPGYPVARLRHMLVDSAPVMLLTQSGLDLDFGLPQLPVLVLDEAAAMLAAQADDNPDQARTGLRADHLAYVIYTSGSTGLPKGVMVEHGSVVNFLVAMSGLLGVSQNDALLAVTTLSFDIAALELYLPLVSGAKVVLATRDDAVDGQRLAQMIENNAVTLMQATPATWRMLLTAGWQGAAQLTALCGGEALAADLSASLAARVASLWNLYGPTEATIWASARKVVANEPGAGVHATEPIGKPIANTCIRILDSHAQPVPIGVSGEIYIGGVAVARGYLNLPELTAERFIADQFSDNDGARLYRTGDVGRWLPDGNVAYTGRSDFQVKVRGFRIELGEIEARLVKCDGVREAVVMVRGDGADDQRLVAYLLTQPGAEVTVADLRRQLSLNLADYMVPSAFVMMDAYPLTANGKIDRKALPQPGSLSMQTREYEPPQGALEVSLALIWQDLLGLDRIGRHDHFFELGGHSLLAIQMVSRIQREIGAGLALRDLFADPVLAVVALKLAGKRQSVVPPITPMDRALPLPLSWAQQRLWFLDQFDHAASIAYHMPSGLRLQGELDQAALVQALDRIIARHENLRTRFAGNHGQTLQLIDGPERGFALSNQDLRDLSASQQALALAQISLDEASQEFDLATGPMIRGRLLRLSEDEHVLLITQHHIISDAWSIRVLIAELVALYTAFCQGNADPLPPLALQYADYAAWQRHWLQGAVLAKQIDFWKNHLLGAPTLLELPTDYSRPMQPGYHGAAIALCLPPELVQSLRALSQRHGNTLFMTLLAAWAVLLARLSGQNDIVIGTPVANRQHGGVEALTGFFVNTLALRVRLDHDPSVAQLLAQVKADTLDAYEHQDLPFEQVVEMINPPRSMSHSPIFQVMLAMNNTPDGGEMVLPGLTLGLMPQSRHWAQFDLNLSLTDAGDRIEGELVYATDLFEAGRMTRLINQFQVLLTAMVADDQQPVTRLALLDKAARDQVLVQFNANSPVAADHRLIHQIFEARALQYPDSVAVVFEGNSLSYDELNRKSNQLAHYLRQQGVGADSLVAICVQRSLEMIVGLLAVLKAGGAYVPLDPDSPAERVEYMLADAAPGIILTQAHLKQDLPASSAKVIAIDGDWSAIAAQADSNPDANAIGLQPHHLAYVIYTSGSTGNPKGVMIAHANVVRLFGATGDRFGFHAQDTWTLFHSYAFDFSVWEIWGALLYGAKLVVVPYLVSRSPQQFHTLLAQHKVTVLNQTPSAFQQLIDVDVNQATQSTQATLSLRYVIFGGEALNQESLAPWFRVHGDDSPALINMYGITETTVHVTYLRILKNSQKSFSVGYPIADLQAYILDPHLQPQPVGVIGELYIAGGGLARGYLNRAELTAERFIANPFAANPDARMYKSGDLACYRPDGSIDYLGRNDFQVKIRGFRIELGEIEARLSACDGVKEAVVIAREDAPGDKRLVAYVIATEGSTLDVAMLRQQLARNLAQYMIPAAFVALDAYPLTVNGKLDRRALPAPDSSSAATREYEPPQGVVEMAIAQIWQELLGIGRIGRHDQFFELGGHSMMVISLIERLRQLGWHIDVRNVFSSPTVVGMAALVTGQHAGLRAMAVPPNRILPGTLAITPDMLPLVELSQMAIDHIVAAVPHGAANIQDIYPLGPLQAGILFHHLMEAEGDAYLLRSVISFDSRARLDTFLSALQCVIDRHDILRSAVMWEGLPQPVQVVFRQALLPVEYLSPNRADNLQQDGLTQLLQHADPRHLRMDVRRAPLMAAWVADDPASGGCHLALLNHHLVCDHITVERIIAEIAVFMQGQGDRLPASLPYRNFIARTLQIDQAAQEAYFKRQLGDIDEPTAPFGLLNVQGSGEAVVEHTQDLDDTLAQQLRETARQHGVAPAVLFHVAWAQLLAQSCDRDDVVFGSVLSGRMQGSEGADQVLGMFISTQPVRISLGKRSALQVLQETYRQLTELLAHEQASLALAQRCSAVTPPLPLFTTLLNFRHSAADNDKQADALAWQGIRFLSNEERTNYPLGLLVDDLGQGFSVTAQCDGVDPVRIVDMVLAILAQLVDALIHQPQRPIASMSILPPAERQRILHDFNQTDAAYPDQGMIHQVFEERAARCPDAIALEYEGRKVTYADLNARANRLAHFLLALGVQPDDRVAFSLERGITAVVAMLGILKAGGGYVPIDPGYPEDRIIHMLTDSMPVAWLIDGRPAIDSTVLNRVRLVVLDDETGADTLAINSQSSLNPDARATGLSPRHLAYVIYTSGSTGVPKGVMVEHRSVLRLVINQTYAPMSSADCIAQCANLAFDAATWEIWAALLNGGRLLILPQPVLFDVTLFGQRLIEGKVSALWMTVGLFNEYVDNLAHAFSHLTYLLVGGDALDPKSIARLLNGANRPAHLINGYGPTETTTFAITHEIGAVPEGARSIPIGRPIANTRVYILDRCMQPVPIGAIGEIYIGGPGVARGYQNQADLTAARFIVNPFGSLADDRLYRTGDLGRWLENGDIEYQGRNDFQLKIRGFRIEPGEIEAQLAACDGIREALVIARDEGDGEKRLIAYVIADDPDKAPDAADLRRQLSRHLAPYMVPGIFVTMSSFPLTANGKIDRRALPEPELAALPMSDYEAPQGEVESALVLIWQELLGHARIGRRDHFFELGGHSLLAIQLQGRIRQAFNIALDLDAIFKKPDLVAMADVISSKILAQFDAGVVESVAASLDDLSEEELLAMLAQERKLAQG